MGKATLLVYLISGASWVNGNDVLNTKPWKKKLIQPMMTICGTIMTICVFIPAIIPSMAAGSDKGLGAAGGASPFFGGPSLR